MNRSKAVLGAAIAALAWARTAGAGMTEKVRSACVDDSKSLCAKVIADDEKTIHCLAMHELKLSPPCRAQIQNTGFKSDEDACAIDISIYCKNVPKGKARAACLKTHASELKESCKQSGGFIDPEDPMHSTAPATAPVPSAPPKPPKKP